jgi:hypothetical protein
MNIFVTDPDPVQCAKNLCDVHIRKMAIEQAQLLSAAHIVCDDVQVAYRKTHHNHPCAVWVRASRANYIWAWQHLAALLAEYEYRFNKRHKTADWLEALRKVPTMPDIGLTRFAVAMPEHLRQDDVCASYRRYLLVKLMEWRGRERRMNTGFTYREVPAFLLTVSPRYFPQINLGVVKCQEIKL